MTARAGLRLDSAPNLARASSGFGLTETGLAICDGDSIAAQSDSRSLAGHLQMLSGGRIDFHPLPVGSVPSSVGAGGRTAAQALAAATRLVSTYPALRLVFLHIGTNSIIGTSDFDEITRDITATIDIYNEANMRVVFSCILPKNGDGALDQGRRSVNAAIASRRGEKLTVVNHDDTHPISDLSWQGKDALPHPNVVGTRRMARNIIDAMLFEESSVLDATTRNLVANPTLRGRSGLVASGFPKGTTAPDGWRLQNDTGADMVASIATESGVRKIQIDVSGSASTAAAAFIFSRNNDTAFSLRAGEWLDGKMDVKITGAGGIGDPVGIDGWEVAAGDSVIFDDASGTAVFGDMSQAVSGPVRVLPLTSRVDRASRTFAFRVQFAVGPVSARLKLSLPVVIRRTA